MVEAALYSIGAVARMIGVSVSTLRTWEDRYGLVVAARSAGGQRRYSRDQLEQLQFVARRSSDGMSPGDAHRLLADRDAAEAVRARERRGRRSAILDPDRRARSVCGELSDYFLRTEGYRVEVVSDAARGRAAISRCSRRRWRSWSCCSRVGSAARCSSGSRQTDALVVVISPLAAGEIAAELGAHAFLQKPIDPVVLISTVRDLLGTSALTQAACAPRA